jgi:Domain of unknown function (DUF6438)
MYYRTVTKFTCLLLAGCASCPHALPMENFTLTLERGACFGSCPTYTAMIFGDGSVRFTGINNVELEGEHKGTLSSDDMCALLEAIDAAGFFQFNRSYGQALPDAPRTMLGISWGDRRNTVQRWVGGPKEFSALVHTVDSLVRQRAFIAKRP